MTKKLVNSEHAGVFNTRGVTRLILVDRPAKLKKQVPPVENYSAVVSRLVARSVPLSVAQAAANTYLTIRAYGMSVARQYTAQAEFRDHVDMLDRAGYLG